MCFSLSLLSLLSSRSLSLAYLRDLAALMVAPDQGDAVRVPHLQGQEQAEGLDGVEAPVHKVAEEEVVCAWGGVPHPEEFEEVIELAVNVAACCVCACVVGR